MSDLPEFVVERVFDAPKEMVWRAWTDPTYLAHWYGPGAETIVHAFDLTVGGMWLNEMRWGGNSNFQKVVFKEISPTDRLVWDHYSSTDANWEPAPNPMMANWPPLLLTEVTLTDQGGQTALRLSQIPSGASAEEVACFAEMMGGMSKGWGSGFDMIDTILNDMKSEGGAP